MIAISVTPASLLKIEPDARMIELVKGINTIQRVGAYSSTKARPIKINFCNAFYKMAVFSQAGHLAGSKFCHISLDNDLTREQQSSRKAQKEEWLQKCGLDGMEAARASGFKAVWCRYNPTKLIIFKGGQIVPPAGESLSAPQK
jgi:hypothetical protein